MCGILAVASLRTPIPAERLIAGLQAIAHRGPDGDGMLTRSLAGRGEIALAHRRLSIFDLSSAGAQPMSDARGHHITFNGSVFNWPELRAELEGHGYRFATQTDTEVILAAYDKWGADCVTRFNGFWAFAIYDEGHTTGHPVFFLSRDRFGIKPLYYETRDGATAFASEICALKEVLGTSSVPCLPELARQLVYQLGDDTDRTIYDGVRELEPSTNALLDLITGEMKAWRYWALSPTEHFEGDDAAALARFTELFEDAVRLRLRADREVALTLSGGVDSSAIAVAIGRVSDVKVRAFTSHFPDHPEIDETRYAALVARKFGMEHVLVQPDLTDLAAEEHLLTRHQEVMYKSFSLLVNWLVIKAIQKSGVRIFLTGQGGDELFLGYERYYTSYLMALARRRPRALPNALIESGRNSRLGIRGVLAYLLYFSNRGVRSLRYRHDARQVYSHVLLAAAHGAPKEVPASMFELQKGEISGSQLRHLLRYDDRTSAAFGTEGRPAFLDHRLVEFAVSLDWRFKIRGGWTKYIVRRYLEQAGLPEIAWRKEKLGYNAPTLDWTNRFLQERGDFAADPVASRLLRPGLTASDIPPGMRFDIYNLLSTAREMRWAI
jgi:asparagine synthase (glutamine-hydrolysing)